MFKDLNICLEPHHAALQCSLVDDNIEWPQDRIEAIIGALASEHERRFRLKIGRHIIMVSGVLVHEQRAQHE